MKSKLFRKALLFFCIFTLLIYILPFKTRAQNLGKNDITQNNYEAVIRKVVEEKINENGGYYQKLEVEILTGDTQGQIFIVENGLGDSPTTQKFNVGDRVILAGYQLAEGEMRFFIDDYVRRGSLISLFIIFLIISIFVAGKRGISSFLGMVITFLMIFWFVLPKISSGSSAVLVVFIFSLISIPITFYLSHGINKKTSVAVVGTFFSLVLTIGLSALYVNTAKLTGFTSDEASFLQLSKGGIFNMKGILLAGIIIGMLGVLDDITVSQSAIVFQLKEANKRLNFSDLYRRSMDVGKDHIASMINTLILVYTGASLPLLLLFTDSSHSFGDVINYEIIASEIIRTLIGSIGLILAVPITTFIAVSVADAKKGGEN